jgi:hypothetical protein
MGKNFKKLGLKVLEIIYDSLMIEDDGSYNSIYKRYAIVGTATG